MGRLILAATAIALGLAAPVRISSPDGMLFELRPNEACADGSLCNSIPDGYCGGVANKTKVFGS